MADNRLIPPKAPNLPLGTVQYSRIYIDQLTNALRLYFNTIDTDLGVLLGPLGGAYFNIPHIAASDTTDQYALGNDTPTQVQWNSLESGAGFVLTSNYAAPEKTGVYKIDYSLQFANTANAAHDVYVWLEVNGGTQVPNSASKFTIPARKSAGVPSFLVAYSSITFEVTGGDEVKLYWATEQAYNPVGPVDGIYMEYIPAQTVPYAHLLHLPQLDQLLLFQTCDEY
jgi:hypothetical protein